MKKTLFALLMVFALVCSFGANAFAVPGENGSGYTLAPGQTNLIGSDRADNAVTVIYGESDRGAGRFAPGPYGLSGKSQQ